jgi:hypothetical protein
MKVLVCGSRGFKSKALVKQRLKTLPKSAILLLGGAKGADALAAGVADGLGMRCEMFFPDYDRYPGRVAPLKRNDRMLAHADKVIAFWDGESKGTKYVIDKALKMKIDLEVNYG